MENRTFVLDTIVTNLYVNNIEIKYPEKLRVEVNFNNKKVNLSRSRINVSEFKNNSSVEFQVAPDKLRTTLEDCGIRVTVRYEGRPLGAGKCALPQNITDQIADNMSDLIISESCTFEQNGQAAGTVRVYCRLVIKCDQQTKREENQCGLTMDKSINPTDIMFLVSESQPCGNPCDPCLDELVPEEGDDRLTLDLHRYTSIDVDVPKPMEILKHDATGDSVCYELKKMTNEYEAIIDTVLKRTGLSQSLKTSDQKIKGTEPITTSTVSYVPMINDWQSIQMESIRFCPVCLNKMSWLPKFAACPQCGVKPMPVIEELPQKEQLTVEQILIDLFGKPSEVHGDICQEARPSDGCQCTCKLGKTCAVCRVHEMCADIFQRDKKTESDLEASDNNSEINLLNPTAVEDSRPFLERVFSELKALYSVECIALPSETVTPIPQKIVRKPIYRKKKSHSVPGLKKKPVIQQRPSKGKKSCRSKKNIISRRHGWYWNTTPEAQKHGWRPGAISKPIVKIMKMFFNRSARHKIGINKKASKKTNVWQQPTLNMYKKNGEIFITLRGTLSEQKQKPIIFKIIKSDSAEALRKIKRILKDKGFLKCTCHNTLMLCTCRSTMGKLDLKTALEEECHILGIENCADDLVLTDTSDSETEFDIDVTPPANIPTQLSHKKSSVNRNTQTAASNRKAQPMYPIKQNPYSRPYDCATGGVYLKGNSTSATTKGQRNQNARHHNTNLNNNQNKNNQNDNIKVKMTERFYEKAKETAKQAKEAMEAAAKPKATDMMKYVIKRGKDASVGPDGLTVKQRTRRALFELPMPPLDTITRLGKGYDPYAWPYYSPS